MNLQNSYFAQQSQAQNFEDHSIRPEYFIQQKEEVSYYPAYDEKRNDLEQLALDRQQTVVKIPIYQEKQQQYPKIQYDEQEEFNNYIGNQQIYSNQVKPQIDYEEFNSGNDEPTTENSSDMQYYNNYQDQQYPYNTLQNPQYQIQQSQYNDQLTDFLSPAPHQNLKQISNEQSKFIPQDGFSLNGPASQPQQYSQSLFNQQQQQNQQEKRCEYKQFSNEIFQTNFDLDQEQPQYQQHQEEQQQQFYYQQQQSQQSHFQQYQQEMIAEKPVQQQKRVQQSSYVQQQQKSSFSQYTNNVCSNIQRHTDDQINKYNYNDLLNMNFFVSKQEKSAAEKKINILTRKSKNKQEESDNTQRFRNMKKLIMNGLLKFFSSEILSSSSSIPESYIKQIVEIASIIRETGKTKNEKYKKMDLFSQPHFNSLFLTLSQETCEKMKSDKNVNLHQQLYNINISDFNEIPKAQLERVNKLKVFMYLIVDHYLDKEFRNSNSPIIKKYSQIVLSSLKTMIQGKYINKFQSYKQV